MGGFAPLSVGICASREEAGELESRLRGGGYAGPVTAIGSHANSWKEITELPDLIFLAGNEREIMADLAQAARRGPARAVILSPLSAEAGEKLARFTDRLEVIGPDSEGLAVLRYGINLTPLPSLIPGPVSLVTLGSGLCRYLAGYLDGSALSPSTLLSLGAGWGVGLPRVLEWWEGDPEVEMVGVALDPELASPEIFQHLALLSRRKPTVVLWAGEGAEAIARHTGAAVTVSPGEYVGLLGAVSIFPSPSGERLAIVGTPGAHLNMLAGEIPATRLLLGPISAETAEILYRLGAVDRSNPIQLSAQASAEDYLRVIDVLQHDELVDGALLAPGDEADHAEIAIGLSRRSGTSRKPVGLLSTQELARKVGEGSVVASADPSELARIFGHLCRQARRRFAVSEPVSRSKPGQGSSFRLQDFGLEPRPLLAGTGSLITAWRDPRLGPVTKREGHAEWAMLPRTRAEAEEWLAEVGLSGTGAGEVLLALRHCFDSQPSLRRLSCELGFEPGEINERGLEIELDKVSST